MNHPGRYQRACDGCGLNNEVFEFVIWDDKRFDMEMVRCDECGAKILDVHTRTNEIRRHISQR